MKLDDDLCLCFHVSKRKVINFIRINKPRVASQLSDCSGAGTGCGWCRSYLQQLFERIDSSKPSPEAGSEIVEPTTEQYAAARRKYVLEGHGTPPSGAATVN